MSERYALYYTPSSDSLLFSRASRLFGRSIRSASYFEPEPPEGFDLDTWRSMVSEPAHYGLHATLPAPFTLAQDLAGLSRQEITKILTSACSKLAARHTPFATSPLELEELASRNGKGHFLALTPKRVRPAGLAEQKMQALERDCVLSFESMRAPTSEEDIARRGALDALEEHYLRTFGYHLVFERFRFHITLTNCLPEEELGRVKVALKSLFAPFIGRTLRIDAISLCRQEDRNSPFVELVRLPLAKRLDVSPYLCTATHGQGVSYHISA